MFLPSRRWFLGGAAVLGSGAAGAVAGWSTTRRSRVPTQVAPTVPASVRVLEGATARERDLIARLVAARSATAGATALGSRVDILLADHQAHLESLSALLREATPPRPASAGATPTTTASASPAGPAVVTREDLTAWERLASTAAAQDSAALVGAAAVVLGSISACDAAHVAWLT